MSQVCPSSSHQLVAAAIAFRRARRKFPKNYGLCCNPDEMTKLDETESIISNEETIEPENLFTSKKCSTAKSNSFEPTTMWNDECGENGSIKENPLRTPIICSCCRKRSEQCSGGDALDIVPSKERNEVAKKCEVFEPERSESNDEKTNKSLIPESGNINRCRTPHSRSQRRSPNKTSSKLDSVNLLYDVGNDEADNVKACCSSEKQKCNEEEYSCDAGRRDCKSVDRNSRSRLNVFNSLKDNPSANMSRNSDIHCAKHSTLDLLRPHPDCCHSHNRHSCCHSHDNCHNCHERYSAYPSKFKPRLTSETCLCSTHSNSHAACCSKDRATCGSTCNHSHCHAKQVEKISTIQEQNDDELDECVDTIHHKDSLCILVEKYKTSRKCKMKKHTDEAEVTDERDRDECNKSLASEMICQPGETHAKQRDKCLDSKEYQFRENNNNVLTGKPCSHGCGQIFREGDCTSQLKNLKSRLIKTGTCCSAKGTPWRHTF